MRRSIASRWGSPWRSSSRVRSPWRSPGRDERAICCGWRWPPAGSCCCRREFTGPFAVAVAGSRRASDLLWVALAAGGIVLLSPGIHGSLDTTGALLALLAGAFWASYIVLAARVGRAFSGGQGLSIAMVVATVVLLPSGIVAGGSDLGDPGLLAAGFAVAMLSSAIPYSLELEALRRLPKGTFGVLMSLEPAVAALVGLVALGQDLSANEVVAVALVVAASAGALSAAGTPSPVEA